MNRVTRAIAVLLGQDEHAPAATAGRAAPDSTPLAVALIACLDLLERDEEAAERATAALADAGVVAIDTVGARFDHRRHRAQGRIDTDDPSRDWIVANCVQVGWARGETILRPAEVWVYRVANDAGAGPA